MEAAKMKTEKKELLKKFKQLIDDVMDHYEEYTEEERLRSRKFSKRPQS